jgi:hypothetical protein
MAYIGPLMLYSITLNALSMAELGQEYIHKQYLLLYYFRIICVR